MKKIYIILFVLVILVGGWAVWHIIEKNKADTEIKQTFKEFVEPRYLNGKESFLSDDELASTNDRLTIKSMQNPELFSNLVLEFIKTHASQRSYGITKKNESLASIMSYTPGVKGVNKNVFNNLLKYAQTDTQNRQIYTSIINGYLIRSSFSCISSGWEMRPGFVREWCKETNNPYNLVYGSLGKYGADVDSILINGAIKTFFDYDGTMIKSSPGGINYYRQFATALQKKYGHDVKAVRNDSIVKGINTNGEMPEALSKELGI